MSRISSAAIITFALLGTLGGILLFPRIIVSLIPTYFVHEITPLTSSPTDLAVATSTIYFTGDVMLARHVESFLQREGSDYPYRQLAWLTATPAYVVGNFESAIPEQHSKTPNFGFRFSTETTHLAALRKAGFSHLSLANNHALDFGNDGFVHTQNELTAHSLTTFGHPTEIGSQSITYVTIGGERVAIIGIHTLFSTPGESELATVVAEAALASEFQIAYIHWGNEYESIPSANQRELAATLIEYGVDLIIGHHPHVTQSVEVISDVPVFYSLGNFIFDQYFSTAVQQGLVLKLEKVESGHTISLIPVTSQDVHAQPRRMTESERTSYFKKLAEFSSPRLADSITKGELTLPYTLATLTETAIMGE